MKSRVYFAKTIAANGMDMGVIKIGSSADPEQRMAGVGTQMPFHCELIATVPGELFVERAVQIWLRADKVRGEFFHARGEVLATMEYSKATGRLPFPLIETDGGAGMFRQLNLPRFMEQRGISFDHMALHTGCDARYYAKLLAKDPSGNRHVLAALSVTAIRMGQTVSWPRDFTFDTPLARAA